MPGVRTTVNIESAPISPPLTYIDAELYIATLTHNNHFDWRFPSWWELTTADIWWYNDPRQHNPALLHYQVIPVRTIND